MTLEDRHEPNAPEAWLWKRIDRKRSNEFARRLR
jgi:hypothetical protein